MCGSEYHSEFVLGRGNRWSCLKYVSTVRWWSIWERIGIWDRIRGWRGLAPESEEQNGKAANKVQTKVTGWHKFKSHLEREPKGEGQDFAERGERWRQKTVRSGEKVVLSRRTSKCGRSWMVVMSVVNQAYHRLWLIDWLQWILTGRKTGEWAENGECRGYVAGILEKMSRPLEMKDWSQSHPAAIQHRPQKWIWPRLRGSSGSRSCACAWVLEYLTSWGGDLRSIFGWHHYRVRP